MNLRRFAHAALALALCGPFAACSGGDDTVQLQRGTEVIGDAVVHSRVVGALAFDHHVSAYPIDVRIDDGVATLSGAVGSNAERDLAVEIARGVEGVSDVRSQLRVDAQARRLARTERSESRRDAGDSLEDAGTTAAVKAKLQANPSIGRHDIAVDTHDGVVTLRGTVDDEVEAALAEHIARNSAEVAAVRNDLKVTRR